MLYLNQNKSLIDEYQEKILPPVRNSPKKKNNNNGIANQFEKKKKKNQDYENVKDVAIKNLKNH